MATLEQINQANYDALEKEGFGPGDLNGMTLRWLQSEGATSKDLNTSWHQYWNVYGIQQGLPFNDRQSLWVKAEGFLQPQINDALFAYWNGRLAAP